MMKNKIIVLLLLFSFSLSADKVLVRLENQKEIFNFLQNIEFETTYSDENVMDIIIDNNNLHYLKKLNPKIIASEDKLSREIENYRSYDQIVSSLEDYAENYPNIVQLVNFGPSTCHRYYIDGNTNYEAFQHDIIGIKLSDNPTEEEDEINVFYIGAIHARELISTEVTMAILNHLITNYGIDTNITEDINNLQIWFVPIMNPDGYKIVYDQLNIWQRKNGRDNNNDGEFSYSSTSGSTATGSTIDGVDLNRNFGYVWGPNGTSSDPNSILYRGPEEWSEIETVYMRNLVQSRKFFGGIVYHSYAEKVLYPLGNLPDVSAYDNDIMADLAENMAATIPRINTNGFYTAIQSVDFGYTCQGTFGDWGYAEERIFSFTIELADEFIPEEVTEICNDNIQSAMIFLNRVNSNTVTGHVYDENGNPIEAQVFVESIDDQPDKTEVEPYLSDENFGRYIRPLLPGNYNVIFSKDGYLEKTYNVNINNDDQTILDVTLFKEYIEDITISTSNNSVRLEWNHIDGMSYEVYSATSPTGNFTLDTTGFFINDSTWVTQISNDRQFFKVKRISQ